MELSWFADTDLIVRPSTEPVVWPGGALALVQASSSISHRDMEAARSPVISALQGRTLSFCPATGCHLPCWSGPSRLCVSTIHSSYLQSSLRAAELLVRLSADVILQVVTDLHETCSTEAMWSPPPRNCNMQKWTKVELNYLSHQLIIKILWRCANSRNLPMIITLPYIVPAENCGFHPIQNFSILGSISKKFTLGPPPSL